jgi:ABC-type transporter MlaC component
MPRLTLLAAAPLAVALLCPTNAAADSSEMLAERYIASTFRAMADTATRASSPEEAATALGTLIQNGWAVDAVARFVLGRDWPSENPASAARFRHQFLHFTATALAGALRSNGSVTLSVQRSHHSDGRILVDSTLISGSGRTLPVTWVVRTEGPKGRKRIEDFVVAGLDAEMMLRNLALTALERNPGNLDAVAALFDRLAARAGGPAAETEGTPP